MFYAQALGLSVILWIKLPNAWKNPTGLWFFIVNSTIYKANG